jgi:multidrug transporter EmrE-like cation transporter
MKNSFYVIASLLIVIWGVVFFGFNPSNAVHLILVVAGIIILIRLLVLNKLFD